MRRIAIALAAVIFAGCTATEGAPQASESDKTCKDYWNPQEIYAEEKKQSEADKAALDKDGNGTYCDEEGVEFKTVADTVQHAKIGEKIEQQEFADSGEVIGVWRVHSAHVDAQRPIAEEYGGGVADGPILVLDVSFEHLGKGYQFVGSERTQVYTSHTIYDPQLENGDWTSTYGWRDGEWYSFGDEIGPGITERGLIMVKISDGEEPRFLKIYSDSAASPDSYPIAKVDLSGVAS